MATNLFEAFDAAFAQSRRSRTASLLGAIATKVDEMRRRRRHRKAMRYVMELPPHLLSDIGLHRLNGRLWPVAGTRVSYSEWR